jgi:hypothetical protein
MYANSYGDLHRARRRFRQISAAARRRLASADYTLAERRCPQRMPIAGLMAEAMNLFG